MSTAANTVVALVGLLHAYILVLEMFLWDKPAGRRAFGSTREFATATKVTGDDHVPAGQITWRADVATCDGEGQIAEHDFRNARFIPGRLFIRNRDHIRFEWFGVGAVEFRRDD